MEKISITLKRYCSKYRRFFALLFLLITYCQIGFSQDFKDKELSKTMIELSENTSSLGRICQQVQAQTGLSFQYDVNLIVLDKQIILKDKKLTLNSLFNALNAQTGYRFKQEDKIVRVVPPTIAANAPKKELRGIVIEAKEGIGMAGVAVRHIGSTEATITNDSGVFVIKVPASEKQPTLSFSFIGYETKQVAVGNTTFIEVTMSEASDLMNEVVVIGYGAVQKADKTGAIGSVDMKDLELVPVRSLDEALAGRVAGVQVTSPDGQPGAESEITIRGTGTLSQSSAPLYVIDGFPQESNVFNSLNPNDIESIEVLKDASATAIYGARGANGVIIITTKKGKTAKPTVSYNAFFGQQEVLKFMELLSPYEFVRLQTEISPTHAAATYFKEGKTLDYYKNVEGIDWQRQILKPASFQNHSISVSGKSGKTSYFLSGNYVDQQGLVIKSGYKRYQGRLTLEQEVSNNLKIGLTTNYASVNSYGVISSQQTQTGGTGEQNNAQLNLMWNMWSYRPVSGFDNLDALLNAVEDADAGIVDLDRFNPLINTQNIVNDRLEQNMNNNAYAEIRFLKNFKLRISAGANLINRNNEVFNNQFTRGGSQLTFLGAVNGPNGRISNDYAVRLLNENTLTYDKKFKNKTSLNIMAGFTAQQDETKGNSFQAIRVPNPSLGVSGLDEGVPFAIGSYSSMSRLVSGLGRINLGLFDSRYLLTASFRADGSSKFSPDNKWGYFPSGAFAWRFTKEPFLAPLSKKISLTEGKLRLSYGITGNNRISDFGSFSTITTPFNSRYAFNNTIVVGSAPNTIENPSLTWETSRTIDAGIELTFLEGKYAIEVDYYRKKTSDLLLNATVSSTTGFTSAFQNIGDIENRGLEIALRTTNIRSHGFTWKTNFTLSFNRNRVLALANNELARLDASVSNAFSSELQNIPLYIARVGHPVAQFYGYISDGLYRLADFDKITTGTTSTYILKDGIPYLGTNRLLIQPGDVKFRDLNGDGVLNANDYTVIGNPYPKHFGGIANNFTYKNFDLNVFLHWSYGNEVYNANNMYMNGITLGDTRGLGLNMFSTYADRWTPDNDDAKHPRAISNVGGMRVYSDRFVEDASFIRLKNVTLGYNLPAQWLRRLKLSTFKVYVSALNLKVWTNYSGPDPEVNTKPSPLTPGFDFSPYPRTKVIVGGVNISF